MMTPEKRQREFLPFFCFLLALDGFAAFVMQWGGEDLAPLLALWYGPLDDIFYGLAGLQALYFLLDPKGSSRSEGPTMGSLETAKTAGGLFYGRRNEFSDGFYQGSRRSMLGVSGLCLVFTLASVFTHSLLVDSVAGVLQRQLAYLFPVSLVLALMVRIWWTERVPTAWFQAVLACSGTILVTALSDGRLGNHLLHLFLSVESMQAWGAALCWVGLGARYGTGVHAEPDAPRSADSE